MNDIADTIALIQVLHKGQFDWTGDPYWHHPVAVMNLLPENSPVERKLIALLHDVIEDCRKTIGRLINSLEPATTEIAFEYLKTSGYSERVLAGVELLTREDNVPYLVEIRKIIASGNIDAMWVKYCDNTHNTNEERILRLPEKRLAKVRALGLVYEQSKILLRNAIENCAVAEDG